VTTGTAPRSVPDSSIGPVVVAGEPVEVADRVVRVTATNPSIMTGPGTNTYLLGRSDVVVIDPGPVLDSHLDVIERAVADAGGTIRWIAVTHHHRDHAPGAVPLAERTGADLLAFGHPEGVDPDRPVGEGFVLAGPDFHLRALHTPGHASDHVCWLLEEESLLFSGDHVMQGSTVVIRPPDANMADYLANLTRLADLDPAIGTIAPGHGRLIGDPAGVIGSIVRHRLEREDLVAAALHDVGRGTVEDLLPSVYADVSGPLLAVARFSLWAHLQKLAADGRARLVEEDESDPLRSSIASTWEAVSA
jgi:glyoxylase-like metal-dependent hydrolase (beta-lactamase superfamily II)